MPKSHGGICNIRTCTDSEISEASNKSLVSYQDLVVRNIVAGIGRAGREVTRIVLEGNTGRFAISEPPFFKKGDNKVGL